MPNVDLGLVITASNNASAGLNSASAGVKKLGEHAQETHNRLKAIWVVLASMAAHELVVFGKQLINISSNFEATNNRIAAFSGGTKAAASIFNELSDKFRSSGLDVEQLGSAFVHVQAAIGNVKTSLPLIEAITNDVVALGGTNENVDNLAMSFQRLAARGTVSLRDFNSIAQNTPVTLQDMAKAAHMTTAAFEGELRNGFLHAGKFIDAFISASKTKVGEYAQYMQGTLAGAISDIRNSFNEGVGELGGRTNANDQLIGLFHNIAGAVRDFIGAIGQKDVDHFFNLLKDMEPEVVKVAESLWNIAKAATAVFDKVVTVIGGMPQESTEYGMIGYYIFGRKGMLIGALLGEIKAQFPSLGSALDAGAADGQRKVAALFGNTSSAPGTLKNSPFIGKSLFPTQWQLDDIKKKREALTNHPFAPGSLNDEDNSREIAALERARALAQAIKDMLASVGDGISAMMFKTTGDAMGASLAVIDKQTDAWITQLNTKLSEIEKQHLTKPIENEAKTIQDIKDTIARANDERIKAKQHEQELYAIETKRFVGERQAQAAQMQQRIFDLTQSNESDPGKLLSAATEGGKLYVEVLRQQLALKTELVGLDNQIRDANAEILKLSKSANPLDAVKIASLQDTIDGLETIKEKTKESLAGLSAEGEINKQYWKDLGETMHTEIADALDGIITRTKTWGEVGQQVLGALTKLAIDYFLKLAEADWQQSNMGKGSGGGGGDMLTKGLNWIGSNIPKFAAGGVVNGSTVANIGENGPEGVFPLTRGKDGKLGIKGAGAGDTYNITVQAIDTQSGLEFIAKNISAIDRGMQHRRVLNNRR